MTAVFGSGTSSEIRRKLVEGCLGRMWQMIIQQSNTVRVRTLVSRVSETGYRFDSLAGSEVGRSRK